ncbi:hypothetical protein, partial [Helicobacter sp. T3_23-1059]
EPKEAIKSLQNSASELSQKVSNATNLHKIKNLDTIMNKNNQQGKIMQNQHIKMNSKTKDYLSGLPLSTQDDFNVFVDNVLNKNYAKAPNIQRIATISAELKKVLNLQGDRVFMLKSALAHLRPERKSKYRQALKINEIKELPKVINNAKSAYKDETGFFITFADKNNEQMMNFVHFKADNNGNFIVTAKKADKRILKNKKPIEGGS